MSSCITYLDLAVFLARMVCLCVGSLLCWFSGYIWSDCNKEEEFILPTDIHIVMGVLGISLLIFCAFIPWRRLL